MDRALSRSRIACVIVVMVLGLFWLTTRPSAAQTGRDQSPAQVFTFDQALQYALDHYPSLTIVVEQINASSANVTLARSTYLPRLDSLWQSNRATTNNIFGQLLPQSVLPSLSGPVLPDSSATSVWSSAAGAFLSWEPVDLGLRGAMVREAEAGLVRARADQGLTRLAVQTAVGTAFLNAATAQQALAAADADAQRREVLARAAHALADNQLRPGAEASRADGERAAAQTRVIQARQSFSLAMIALRQLLGITTGEIAIDGGRLLDSPSPDEGVATESATPERHPLVQSNQAAVDLARAREAVLAKTDRPRLYLQSSVFARGSGASPEGHFDEGVDGLGLSRTNWAAGVQIVFPNLFDFASLHARRAAAGAATREETARYDEARLTITSQQRAAAAVLDAARAIANNTPIQLAAARQSETQARARYDAGLASIVEVADAQNLLANAEFQDAQARVDVWRALLGQAAAGGDVAPLIARLRTRGAP
jgi:outer membrane protein TolC